MELFCLGLSHHTTAVSLREQFVVPEAGMADFLGSLRSEAGMAECVLLSTCNRVEIYGAARDGVLAASACSMRLQQHAGIEADLYRLDGVDAARHLIRVAAGLDSMVVGETEILGQVKDAYALAWRAGMTGPVLNRLFQRAFQGAKQVRTETGITRGSVSVGSAACHLAARALGSLSERRVLLLGAGEAGGVVARSLKARGIRDMAIVNRTPSRASDLAVELGGRTVEFAAWQSLLPEMDIVVACASSPSRLLQAVQLAPVMAGRPERPLFILDLAVPRDFDPEIRNLPGVDWHDVDSLQALARGGVEGRVREMQRGEELVVAHADGFMRRIMSGEALPVAA